MKKFLFLIMLFTLTIKGTQTQMHKRYSKKPTGLQMHRNWNVLQLIKKTVLKKEEENCYTQECALSSLEANVNCVERTAFCTPARGLVSTVYDVAKKLGFGSK